mgnify:CR=1 FL=1|jgi:hypothetical protein|tara:strand:- start:2063 stop:2212 length:150 start_codon:yes stop_codon:yes gene_type:complete
MSKKLTPYELEKKIQYHEKRANYYYDKLEAILENKRTPGFKLKKDRVDE